jgi:RNA polymerase sigma-70 factor (sigma-E family)
MQTDGEIVRIEGKLLGELYVRHAPDALRLAYLLTGDRSLAEDLVQDAFVRVAGRLLHLRSSGMFYAYLRTTVVNLARSHGRRKAVERSFAERAAAPKPVGAFDPSDRDELRTALMSLPLRQRTAVVLRYYEDLPESQVAEVMRCRTTAVRSLVARGVAALRTTVKES